MRYSVEFLNKVQLPVHATAPVGVRGGAHIGLQAANVNRVYSSVQQLLERAIG
jgi:hypothetical protein